MEVEESPVEEVRSRSGRVIAVVKKNEEKVGKPGRRGRKKGKENTTNIVSQDGDADSDPAAAPEEDDDDNTSWICMECNEAECDGDPDAPLMICEGTCRRIFHPRCIGLKSVPEEEWICSNCKEGRHACFICSEVGVDNVEGGVVKCKR